MYILYDSFCGRHFFLSIVTTDISTVAYLFVELRFWLKYSKYISNHKTRALSLCNSTLVQTIAWCLTGDKPLSEPLMAWFTSLGLSWWKSKPMTWLEFSNPLHRTKHMLMQKILVWIYLVDDIKNRCNHHFTSWIYIACLKKGGFV